MHQLKFIRLERDLEARLERLARLSGRSTSVYVNRLLEEQVRELEARSLVRSSARRAAEARERIAPLYELECALVADD